MNQPLVPKDASVVKSEAEAEHHAARLECEEAADELIEVATKRLTDSKKAKKLRKDAG